MSVEISLINAQYTALEELLTQLPEPEPKEVFFQPLEIGKFFDAEGRPYQLYLHPDNDAKEMTWDDAMTYAVQCRDGGYDDWVLPNRQELLRLYELQESGDLPDDIVFIANTYWSSSAASATYAWRQNFLFGFQVQYSKTSNGYVRLVRRLYI